MVIRGAPAIGVAAAMGVALGMKQAAADRLDEEMEAICSALAATRPTAVNLFWGIERMKKRYHELRADGADPDAIRDALVQEAQAILEEDIAINQAIGRHGADLVDRWNGLTDRFGELDFELCWRTKRGASGHGLGDRGHHLGVRVAQDQRPPARDHVDVAGAVGAGDIRALAARDKERIRADRAARANGRVDAARDHAAGPVK